MGRYITLYPPKIGTDTDALAFLAAAGITDATQKSAIDVLVKALKAAGVWSKMKAVYPFIGGTSSTHKWNLKDPRDLDAAFRLSFIGSPTHSANGVDWNGTTQYADTFLNPSTSLARFSSHLSYYTREAVTESNTSGQGVIGCGTSGTSEMLLSVNRGNKHIYWANSDAAAVTDTNASPQNGFFVGARTANNAGAVYRNGLSEATSTVTDTGTLPSFAVSLGRVSAYATSQCAFASIGDGLASAEVLALYTAVQAYQTTLSRQV